LVRFGRYGLPLLLLGVAVHLILPQMTALEHSLQVIKSMAMWAVALAIGMQLLSYLGSGYLLRAIATMAGQQLSLLRGTMIFAAAASVGLVGGGPVGNAAVTYRWMRGSGVGGEGAILSGWLPSLLSSAMLVLIGILGLAHLLIVHDLSTLQAVGFGLTLALLGLIAGVVLWGVHHRSHSRRGSVGSASSLPAYCAGSRRGQALGGAATKDVRSGPGTGSRRTAVQCVGHTPHQWMARVDRGCSSEYHL